MDTRYALTLRIAKINNNALRTLPSWCCARLCTTHKYIEIRCSIMARVIHKRGNRRYWYEHKRVDGRVVAKYIGPVEDGDILDEKGMIRAKMRELEARLKEIESMESGHDENY